MSVKFSDMQSGCGMAVQHCSTGGVIHCSLAAKGQFKADKLEGPEICSGLLSQSRVAAIF